MDTSAADEDDDSGKGASSPEVEHGQTSSASLMTSMPTRSSMRVLRKREEERLASPIIVPEEPAEASTPIQQQPAARRRTWEQWSDEDKLLFFKALNDCGKNFAAIQDSMASLCKRPSSKVAVPKNREQIRTFYYRTWHKIGKHLAQCWSEELKKTARELYGLINYGELRKRAGQNVEQDRWMKEKLQELVMTGGATIRVKGKAVRVRTPVCRALKRLNVKLDPGGAVAQANAAAASSSLLLASTGTSGGDGPVPEVKIAVNLRPATANDLHRVHAGCVQNPRLRLKAEPSVRLSALVAHLESKWTQTSERLTKALQPVAGIVGEEATRQLSLSLPAGSRLVQPRVTPVKPLTSATLSLSRLQAKWSARKDEDVATAEKHSESPEKMDAAEDAAEPAVATMETHKTEEGESNLKTSWRAAEQSELTLGELCLMLGLSEERSITLCYAWKETKVTELNEPLAGKKQSWLSRLAAEELQKRQAKQLPRPPPPSPPKVSDPQPSPTSTSAASPSDGHEFRRPAVPPMGSLAERSRAFKEQLSHIMPRATNRRGRTPMRRHNVISRQILAINRPVQPKINPNEIVGLKVPLPRSQQQIPPQPIILVPTGQVATVTAASPMASTSSAGMPQIIIPESTEASAASPRVVVVSTPEASEVVRPPSPSGSISSLFAEESTRSTSRTGKGDGFLDAVLDASSSSSVLQTPPRVRPTPPTSPSRAWMPDEELSLSNFLHFGESPAKQTTSRMASQPPTASSSSQTTVLALNEDSSHSTSSEVDRQLQNMLSENSVDFSRKFAFLASHLASGEQE